MALNTIILPYNKILEVEECDPVSSPSSTSFEEQKSVPDYFCTSLYQTYNFPIELSNKKTKSSPSSLDSHDFHQIFFGENNNEIMSLYSQKEINKIPNLNINKEKNNINNDWKDNTSIERTSFQVNKLNSSRSNNKNPFQRANNDISEENNKKRDNFNFSKLHKNNNIKLDQNDKNKIYRLYDNYTRNPKINPVKEDNQIESFMEEISHIENKIKSINTEEKKDPNSLNKKEIPKIKPIINKMNKISINPNINYRNSNPNPLMKNGIYCKKKISDSNSFGIKKKNDDNSSTFSIKRDSVKTYNFVEIKAKNRPLELNVNSKKIHLKISQFQKILKSDGLFYLLRFLDYFDIINLYKAKNKQLCILINTSIINAYYLNIKESLMKYNNIIELLKCTIVQSKIKNALKIDFVINIRFIHDKNNSKDENRKIKLGGPDNNFIEPVYFQFSYIYNYFQKVKNKKELITKEEYEKQIKKLKMYDYYTFDLYPEENKNNNIIKNNPIFISKELSLFDKDGNNNIVNIQPILPFCINDKGIINLELYTTNNGFIDPDSIRIIVKTYNLKNYIKMYTDKNMNNPRISECEDLCVHWKNINLYDDHKSVLFKIKKIFEPYFEINKISFENIGVYIFKVYLKAIKSGEINDKNKIEIKIKIKDKDDYIENEIRKNNLLFERRDIFELRVGEQLLYYFSMK